MIPLLLAFAMPQVPDVVVTATFGKVPVSVGLSIKHSGVSLHTREAELLKSWSPSADGSDPLDRLAPEGRLWRIEFPGPSHHAKALTRALANALDANHDAILSHDELKAATKLLLAKFDADGDECLTPLELVPDLLTHPADPSGIVTAVATTAASGAVPKSTVKVRLDQPSDQRILDAGGSLEIVTINPNLPTIPPTPQALLRLGRETERTRFEAVAKSIVTITVRPEPRGWFELFDLNADGQLSLRELRAIEKLLLSRSEANIVRLPDDTTPAVTIVVSRGLGTPPPVRLTKVAQPARGAAWFLALDRNDDGDVSRREFIGTDSQFQHYDTDHDGLISADEADAGDRKLTSGKTP